MRWSAVFLASGLSVLAVACSSDTSALTLRVETSVTGLQRLTARAFAPTGALGDEATFPASGAPRFPGEIHIDTAGRTGVIRILLWGWKDGARVAFAQTSVTLVADATQRKTVTLDPIPPDGDADGVPNSLDVCPAASDPAQLDANADGVGDACSLDGGSGGGSGGSGGGSGGAGGAGGGTTDGGRGACPGNLIQNPDFETSTAPWAGYAPGASVVDISVTQVNSDVPGAGLAGRLCRPSSTPQYMSFIHSKLYPPPPVGRGYALSAWVRRAPVNADAGSFTLSIALRSRNDAGTEILQQKHPYSIQNSDVAWQKIETTYPVVSAGSGIATFDLFMPIDAPVPPGLCLDVDDVCLVMTP